MDGLSFVVPSFPLKLEVAPSAAYHSLVGRQFYVVQWELLSPGCCLQCLEPGCGGLLVHERNTFMKNNKLVPIFGMEGEIDWMCCMSYRCNSCSAAPVPAVAPRLLAKLPTPLRMKYPVDPRYSRGSFHLHKKTSDWLRRLTLTYGSVEMFAKIMYEMLGGSYVERVDDYVEQSSLTSRLEKYPSFQEWVGFPPPSGPTLQALMFEAEQSELTATGVSDYDRHRRELQAVGCKTCFSYDHCAATSKCFKSAGIKYTWNVTNERGEIMSCVAVGSTKTYDVAHAAEQLVRRDGFKAKVLYSDVWPSGDNFWKKLVGPGVVGRLGLFHFFQRIIRTLRDNHDLYYNAIELLKQACYYYEQEDLNELLEELKAGTMGRQNKAMSMKEINQWMYSTQWKNRYDCYLRKVIRPGNVIEMGLSKWLDR